MTSAQLERTCEGPLAKRQKLESPHKLQTPQRESRIFTPFRTIGLVSPTSVPFTSVPLGKTTFQITTSVGKCLQTYDLKSGLQLVFLTRPQTPEKITATLAWKSRVFAAWGGSGLPQGLWVFQRGKKIAELDLPTDSHEPVKQIVIFGNWIIGCCTTRIEVWKSTTYEHYTTLFPTATTKGGNEVTGGICNMPTYLNKIFIGKKDGSVEIWNVNSGNLIYTILPPTTNCGAVTAMQPTPALSLLAIAFSDGPLTIHNIRTDQTIMLLDGGNSLIKSISFRTDNMGAGDDGRKPGVMATAGSSNGDVTLWDLNNGGRVMGILRGAHNPPSIAGATVGGGVSKIEFLTGQPVLVSSGLDNSLKTWVFDESPFSPVPRILHSRSGHAGPVSRLHFLPSDFDGADSGGKWLLSAGHDRSMWGWSLRRDGQSTELSQGNTRKKSNKMGILGSTHGNEPKATLNNMKVPEITCIAMSLNRDGGMGANSGNGTIWQKSNNSKKPTDASASGITGWESVVTGHRDDKFARTWFWGKKKAGRWIFETGDGGNVKSVAVSPCGTFAVIGSETGSIDMFNLQSGLHRQRYPPKLNPAQAKKLRIEQEKVTEQTSDHTSNKKFLVGHGKHKKAVTGLVVDSLNKNIISCSLDGKVKFWDFRSGNLVDELDYSTGLTGIRHHSPSDLIAISSDDRCVRVIDIETKKTIREFWGCRGAINDICFSNDGRWIIVASSDCIIRVWDLPTAHLIDAIRMKTQCTALAFSGTGEFLATTCEGELGINIWNNKTLFIHVPTRHISEDDITEISAPTVSGEGGQGLLDGAFEDVEFDSTDTVPNVSPEQLSHELQTLSLVPKSRWQNLMYLDIIKARNKPIEAPKVPEKAPFFLPSLDQALAPKIIVDRTENNNAETSRIMKMGRLTTEGDFTCTLRVGKETGDYVPFISHLQTLSPSSADLEIRSLTPNEELVPFVNALTQRLRQKRDYELIQAWMSVFLRLHADSISHEPELVEALKLWRLEQVRENERIGGLLGYCSGVTGFLRSGR
ncbi:hypothetical protein K3495_g1141 [Podosphaera aphanis]|nr:hypothetical protein K3495_g1141 [Podosphaera aphanis]